MSLKINKTQIMQYFLIYWMLLDAGAAAISYIGTNTYFLSLLLFGAGGCFLYRGTERFKEIFKYRIQLFCLVLFSLYLVTYLITFGGLNYTIILQNIGRIMIVFFAIMIDREDFTTKFVKVVTFLALISLVIFIGYFSFGTGFWSFITTNLPITRGGTTSLGPQYGSFLLVFNYFDPTRNAYIFGEPGEYQLVLSTALFLILFLDTKLTEKNKKFSLIILLSTLITTQSTTGYFNLIVLLVCFFLRKTNTSESDRKLIKHFLFVLIIVIAIGLVFFDGWDYFINKVLVEKTLDESGNIDFTQGTASARWNGFIRVWEYIKNNPLNSIFGIGFSARSASGVTSCNGFTNSILDYGILTMAWLVYSFFRALYARLDFIRTLAGLFVIMNTWFGQPVPIYTLMIVVAFTPLLTQGYKNDSYPERETFDNEIKRISV